MVAAIVLSFFGILRYTILINPTALRAGRYPACAVPAFSLLGAVGVDRLFTNSRRRSWIEGSLGAIVLGLKACYLLGARHFYASYLYTL